MTDERELATWRDEWQSLGGTSDLTGEIAKRVLRDGRRIQRGVLVEIAATIFSTSLCVWLMTRSHGELVTVVVCAGILVFNGVWVTRLLTLRQGTMKSSAAEGSGLDAFVELTRRRMTDDLRWNTFANRAMKVLSVALLPWSIYALVARWPMYRAEPWRAFVGFGAAFAILAGCFVWQHHKKKKLERERDRFETLIADRTMA